MSDPKVLEQTEINGALSARLDALEATERGVDTELDAHNTRITALEQTTRETGEFFAGPLAEALAGVAKLEARVVELEGSALRRVPTPTSLVSDAPLSREELAILRLLDAHPDSTPDGLIEPAPASLYGEDNYMMTNTAHRLDKLGYLARRSNMAPPFALTERARTLLAAERGRAPAPPSHCTICRKPFAFRDVLVCTGVVTETSLMKPPTFTARHFTCEDPRLERSDVVPLAAANQDGAP